jgi:hypothetical protein
MNSIKITAAIFLSLSVIIFSCSKINDFGNINESPGATTTPIPSALLTNVLASLGSDTWDAGAATSGGLTTVCGMYCQYFSETLYTETSNYARPDFNWDNYYAAYLYDLQIIINYNTNPATASKAAEYGSNNNQVAVARILKAYLFSLLTDCYGDLPYTSALQADNGLIAFDGQENIYNSLFNELTAAVEQFDNGVAPFGDILFNGNLMKWKQFANSLHALLALHLSEINPASGKEEFSKALKASGGVFENGVNAELAYPGVNYFNPVYLYHRTTPFRLAVSKTITDWLSSRSDKRITAYGTSEVGFPYGITRDSAIVFNNNNNNWAKILQGEATPASQPFPVILCAEIYLARAEAAQRGWTSENIAAMYKNGIEESWRYWGVYDDDDFAAYLLQPAVKLTGNDILKKICEEEWITHYPNGPRGWTTWRRTGFPELLPAAASTSQTIPRRFPYGSNEYSTNSANVQDAASRYKANGEPDSQYGRLWWDKE